jgi:hypothetical protein
MTKYRKNTPLRKYVWFMAGVSVMCFVTAVITQFTHCLPLHHNWQILPDPGKECSAGIIINIVIAVGNVLVDALLLVVPTLMLKDARITVWRKVRIGFLLSLGIFVMAMAIARCILSIGNSVQVAQASVWAQREAVSASNVISVQDIIDPYAARFNLCSERSNYQRPLQNRDLVHQSQLRELLRKASLHIEPQPLRSQQARQRLRNL